METVEDRDVVRALRLARHIIQRPSCFSVGEFARNDLTSRVDLDSPYVVARCIRGAICEALRVLEYHDYRPDGDPETQVTLAFANAAEIPHEDPVPAPFIWRQRVTWKRASRRPQISGCGRVADWNNKSSHAEVLAALDQAIVDLTRAAELSM